MFGVAVYCFRRVILSLMKYKSLFPLFDSFGQSNKPMKNLSIIVKSSVRKVVQFTSIKIKRFRKKPNKFSRIVLLLTFLF